MPLQARFKDSIRVPTKNSAVLMTVISLGNHLQSGPQWDHFLELINLSFAEKSLKKLIIVTTGHLQCHYFSLGLAEALDEKALEAKAHAMDQQWLEKHMSSERIKLPIEIMSWKDLLNKPSSSLANLPAFDAFFQQIKDDYNDNSEFKNLVNQHAATYVSKKINTYLKNNRVGYDDFLKVSVDYILEECAAVVQLFKCGADLLTYPGGMNPPARYVE
jgi:hypothetical protein